MKTYRRNRFDILPYVYIAPAFLCTAVFTAWPIFYVIYLSTVKWDLRHPPINVGFKNYTRLLADTDFIKVLANTGVYTIAMVIFPICIALALAVWLNHRKALHNFVQTAIFTPHIVSWVSVSLLWMWIMQPDYGLFNSILNFFGMHSIKWYASPDTSMMSIIIMAVWKGVGYNTLVLIAGLQSIPTYLYEASKLDNAPRITTFFKVTVPLVSPSLFFLLIINITGSFSVFDSINLMTQGGPMNSTNMLVYWIYMNGFSFWRFGDAATGSVIMFVVVAVATYFNFYLTAKKVHYQ